MASQRRSSRPRLRGAGGSSTFFGANGLRVRRGSLPQAPAHDDFLRGMIKPRYFGRFGNINFALTAV